MFQSNNTTTCFRILCHVSRIGAVIGSSSSFINQIQLQTSTNIHIHAPNPTSDDRIISIIGNPSLTKTMSFPNNNNNINNTTNQNHSDESQNSEVVITNKTISFATSNNNNNNNITKENNYDESQNSEVVINNKTMSFTTNNNFTKENNYDESQNSQVIMTNKTMSFSNNNNITKENNYDESQNNEVVITNKTMLFSNSNNNNNNSSRGSGSSKDNNDCGESSEVFAVSAAQEVNKTTSFSTDNNIKSTKDNNDCGENREVVVVSAVQEALVRVFERILVAAAEVDGRGLESLGVVSCRLLVDKSGIGSVIGKKGRVIEKIRKETGCKVKVFGQDKMASCALPTDEMVEIEGDIFAIKKALVAVTRCLQDRPHAHKAKTDFGDPHHAVPQETITNGHMHIPSISSDSDRNPSVDTRASQHEIVFRMICSGDRVGSVIGKSGTIINAMQKESGASISFGAPVSECDERVITIAAMETLESRNSPAQTAVILVFNRLETVRSSSTGVTTSARLLISPNQMGCLLGKRGSIIADMRKVTGAVIKIVGDHQVPKCALKNDLVVLMTGEFVNVRDALYSVTGRLRNNLFSSKMSKGHGTRGAYANLPWSMEGLSLSSSIDRPLTPANSPSRINASNVGMGQDVGTRSTSVKGGTELGSGGRSAIVTGMSVEILVPQNVIGRVYGVNESNLTRLREISGAKVVVHKPQSGTTDHIVVISGTPDQTKSAQSLLHAFILSDQS